MRITRDGSTARYPPGNGVPRAIGTSPKIVPGSRKPSRRSIPSIVHHLDLAAEDGKQGPLAAFGTANSPAPR
jgi:hypothetical protein